MHTSQTARMMYLRMDVHVSATKSDIIRNLWPRLAPSARTREYREQRRNFYDCLMLEHKAAQDLFVAVYKGM